MIAGASRSRRVVIVLAGVAALALGAVALLDAFSSTLEISSCPSDNLSTVAATARAYLRQHATLPTDVEVFRRYMVQSRGHDYLYCNRSHRPLVWRPTTIAGAANGIVLVMCPPGSHGLIRRHAWALVVHGTDVHYVIIRGHQIVETFRRESN